MDKEKRKSYVGPKTLDLYLKGFNVPMTVTFPTSIQYNRALELIINTDERWEDSISHGEGNERYEIHPKKVDAIMFAKDQLVLRKNAGQFVAITLTFEDGTVYEVVVAGIHRMRINYKRLAPLVGGTPSKMFIKINQEENKAAYIRHDKMLIAVDTRVING